MLDEKLLKLKLQAIKKIPGVVGAGITHSKVTGISEGDQIIVYIKDITPVTSKLIPKEISGIPVVYKITGKTQIHAFVYKKSKKQKNKTLSSMQYTQKLRPVKGGISGGLYNSELSITGTLGCFVRDNIGRTVVLSNNHVIAWNIDSFSTKGNRGDIIIQPGEVDGGTNNDLSGTLEKSVTLTGGTSNIIDAAYAVPIANINNVDIADPNVCNLYTKESKNIDSSSIGMKLKKAGRTTGCVDGIIESTGSSFDVEYTMHTDSGDITQTLSFDDVITITNPKSLPVSQAGDSGSMWVSSDTNNAVGLNFAGNEDGTTSIACKATNIEKLLCVKFGFSTPPSVFDCRPNISPAPVSAHAPLNTYQIILVAGISSVATYIVYKHYQTDIMAHLVKVKNKLKLSN